MRLIDQEIEVVGLTLSKGIVYQSRDRSVPAWLLGFATNNSNLKSGLKITSLEYMPELKHGELHQQVLGSFQACNIFDRIPRILVILERLSPSLSHSPMSPLRRIASMKRDNTMKRPNSPNGELE